MPIHRREIDNDTDDLLDDITALYRSGRSHFYAEFAPLAKRMRTVNKNRRLYEEQIQDGLPEHPIEQVIDLYTSRTRHEEGTWTLKWIKLGKVLGLVDPSVRDEDDKEGEEANVGATKAARSGTKGRGGEGNEDEAAGRDDTRHQASTMVDNKGKAKERPQPVPTVRKDRPEASAGASKAKVAPETRKGAKPTAAAASSSSKHNTAGASKSTPAASSSKPRSRTAAKAYKSKAIVSDSDDEVVVVAKPKSKTKGVFRDPRDTAEEVAREGRDKRAADRRKGKAAAAAAALEGYGESEEPLEDGFSEDAEGDVKEEEAAVDPNEPPLSKARRRIQEREDSKKIVVFDACHPCIRSGVQCTFSKKRIREANNNAKVVCDHCKQGKTKCVPGPGPEFSLDTPFTDYEDLLFPQRGEGMEDEDDLKTVGDVLATLVREQRVLAEQVTSLTEEVQGLRSGMSTAPQYSKGVAAAVTNVGTEFSEFQNQYKLNKAHNTVVLEALGIRLTNLAQKVDENDVSSTLATILATLEGMTSGDEQRHRRRSESDEQCRRRRSESRPQLDESDEEFAPRTVHCGKQDSGNDDNTPRNRNDNDEDDDEQESKGSSSDEEFVVKKTYPGGGGSGNNSDMGKTPEGPDSAEGDEAVAKDVQGPAGDITAMKVDDKEDSRDAEAKEAEEEKQETEKPEEETEGKGEEESRVSEEREATPKAESRTRPRRNTRSKTAAAEEGELSATEEPTTAAATKPAATTKKRKATAPPDSDSAAAKKKGKNTNS